MNRLLRTFFALLLCLSFGQAANASSMLPITTDRHVQISDAVFRGQILSLQSWQSPVDNHIYTTAAIRVDEAFKGTLPTVINLVHFGGTFGNLGEMDGSDPQLKVGEERIFLVARRSDGTLYSVLGGPSALRLPVGTNTSSLPEFLGGQAMLGQLRKMTGAGALPGSDVTNQAASSQATTPLPPPNNFSPFGNPVVTATNLLVDASGIPARFVLPDCGEPIPYLIDADYLPTGITLTNAVAAVQSALSAWTAVTSVKYEFMGIQSFGQAATNIVNRDGYLRIQLHDHYGAISGAGGDVLGKGGHAWDPATLTNGWTSVGNVDGSDFYLTLNGFIELDYTNVVMQNLSNFSEVLCHEIGHTLGMAHSSENPSEPNSYLQQATMYYAIHEGNRGATLGAYDPPVIRQAHPITNTPPYMYNRMMDITTYPNTNTTITNVNVVQLRGYDLQTTNLTLAISDATANHGTLSLLNGNVKYVPNVFANGPRSDPAGGGFYDLAYARCADGTNASAFVLVRVLSLNADNYSEGIPDAWRTTYFGNANPSIGANHHANNDADGDGYSNLREYLLGSDPTVKSSNLRITNFSTTNLQWQAKPYEVYEIYGSTNLSNWVRVMNPVIPTTTNGTATAFTNGGPKQFFRVEKVP